MEKIRQKKKKCMNLDVASWKHSNEGTNQIHQILAAEVIKGWQKIKASKHTVQIIPLRRREQKTIIGY